MYVVLLLARVFVASVFFCAAIPKLADIEGTRRTISEFGIIAPFGRPLSVVLPVAELIIAASLIPTASAWWGALSVLTLLLVFTAGIGINLARGRRPDCRCFGQLHSEPVGWQTLARNLVLAAVAGFVVWQGNDDPGHSAVAWLGGLTAWQAIGLSTGAAAAAIIAAQTWFLLQLFHQHGRLLLRMDALENTLTGAGMVPARIHRAEVPPQGLPIGAPAPAFSLPDLSGEAIALDDLRARGTPIMLVFVDPGCGPCAALVPDLARWQQQYQDRLTLTLVSRGTPDESRAKLGEHSELRVLLQEKYEVAEAYEAYGTPGAVLIRSDGTIGSPVVMGPEAIRHLLLRTIGPHAPLPTAVPDRLNGSDAAFAPSGLSFGAPAPAIQLSDLAGQTVTLEDLRSQPTALVFWHPGCGFCARMLPDLRRWEADPPMGAPRLVLISGGTVEANRAMDLRSPVLLDERFTAGRAFGAGGTPSAILLDADGKVASGLAIGADQVFALLNAGPAPIAEEVPAAPAEDAKVEEPALAS
jgi:peroxiredoxin